MPDPASMFALRPLSIALTAFNVSMSIIALRRRKLYLQWILHPYSIIKNKEFYRLLTSNFVHNDLMHLLVNSVMLFFIGGELETFLNAHSSYGRMAFLFIYLVSHFSGVLVVTWSNRKNYEYSSAGSSGSIIGCMMSFMILAPHYIAFYLPVAGGIENEYAALILIVGLIIYKQRSKNELLDNEVHFFSALGGIAATFVLFPHLL